MVVIETPSGRMSVRERDVRPTDIVVRGGGAGYRPITTRKTPTPSAELLYGTAAQREAQIQAFRTGGASALQRQVSAIKAREQRIALDESRRAREAGQRAREVKIARERIIEREARAKTFLIQQVQRGRKRLEDLTPKELETLREEGLVEVEERRAELTEAQKQQIADAAKEGKIIKYTPEGVVIEEKPTKFQRAEAAAAKFIEEKTIIKELTPERVEKFAEISARTAPFVSPVGVAGIGLSKKIRKEFVELEKSTQIGRIKFIKERPVTTAALVGVGVAVPPLIKGVTAAAQLGLGVKAGAAVAKGVTVGAGVGLTGIYATEKAMQIAQAKTSREAGRIIGETEVEVGAIALGAGIGARAVRGVEARGAVRRAKKFRLKLVEKPKKFIPKRITDKQLMRSLREFRRGKIPADLKFPTEKAFLREASKIITRRAARTRGIDLKKLSKVDVEFMRGQIAARLRARPESFLPEIHKIAIQRVRPKPLLRRVPEVRRIALERFADKPTKLPTMRVKKPFRVIRAKDIFKEVSVDKGVRAIGRGQLQLLKLKPLVKVKVKPRQIISFKQPQLLRLKQIPKLRIPQMQRQKLIIPPRQVSRFRLKGRQALALGFGLSARERQAFGFVQPQRLGVKLAQPQMVGLGLLPRQVTRERLRIPQKIIQRLIIREPIIPVFALPELGLGKLPAPRKRKALGREDKLYVAGFTARLLGIKADISPVQLRKMVSMPSIGIGIRPMIVRRK